MPLLWSSKTLLLSCSRQMTPLKGLAERSRKQGREAGAGVALLRLRQASGDRRSEVEVRHKAGSSKGRKSAVGRNSCFTRSENVSRHSPLSSFTFALSNRLYNHGCYDA